MDLAETCCDDNKWRNLREHMVILRAFQSRYFLILKLKILSEVCSVLFSTISIFNRLYLRL